MMLHKALLAFMLAFVITLLSSGCAPQTSQMQALETTSPYTQETLIKAVQAADIALIQKHLRAKLDINTKDSSGNSLLHLAVAMKHNKVIVLLLKKDANINILNELGLTPLHLAVTNNSQDSVALLLKENANTSIANTKGYAAIHTATKANNFVIIEMLLAKQPADLKLPTSLGLTPLLVAVESGHLKLIKYYLKNKAQLHVKTKQGLTPLQIAMKSNSLQTFDFLLKKGAKIDQVTADGMTLLHLAAQAGSIKIVGLLIRKGAKVGRKDKKKRLPLDYAVQNAHAKVVTYLLKKYSDFSDLYKFNLLKTAVGSQDIKTLLALHKGGVSLATIQMPTKTSILHYVVAYDKMEAIIALILKKADLITHKDAKGLTALDLATKLKKTTYTAIMKPYFLKVKIRALIAKDNFPALKALLKKYPELLNLIENKKYKLALNGPQELMIGDIKLLNKKGRSQKILMAQINRLETGYKTFSSDEIDILLAYGLPSSLIATVIEKTAKLEKQAAKRDEKALRRALQESLLKVQKKALIAQEKMSGFTKENLALMQRLLQKQDQIIQQQIATRQALKKSKSSSNIGGQVAGKLVEKLLE